MIDEDPRQAALPYGEPLVVSGEPWRGDMRRALAPGAVAHSPKPDVASTLAERQHTHGDYREHAGITQEFKDVMREARDGGAWTGLNSSQREALDMIAHKIGRILAGDPCHHDHWHDIAGYATLVADQLTTCG